MWGESLTCEQDVWKVFEMYVTNSQHPISGKTVCCLPWNDEPLAEESMVGRASLNSRAMHRCYASLLCIAAYRQWFPNFFIMTLFLIILNLKIYHEFTKYKFSLFYFFIIKLKLNERFVLNCI